MHDLLIEDCENKIDWYIISCLIQEIRRATSERVFPIFLLIFDKSEIGLQLL